MTVALAHDADIVDAEIVRTPGEWAEVIRADLGRAVESIVSAGKHLIAAKADVQHGEWLPLLDRIGINERHAQRLMQVGGNAALANPTHVSDVPASLRALMELSRLPPEAIESGIESGDVHPGMTAKDAKGYAAEVADRAAPANVDTDAGEIEPEPEAPKRDRANEKAEREVSIVNDLRLYLRHIGTEKAILGMSNGAKQFVIEALEEAASNLKESM